MHFARLHGSTCSCRTSWTLPRVLLMLATRTRKPTHRVSASLLPHSSAPNSAMLYWNHTTLNITFDTSSLTSSRIIEYPLSSLLPVTFKKATKLCPNLSFTICFSYFKCKNLLCFNFVHPKAQQQLTRHSGAKGGITKTLKWLPRFF